MRPCRLGLEALRQARIATPQLTPATLWPHPRQPARPLSTGDLSASWVHSHNPCSTRGKLTAGSAGARAGTAVLRSLVVGLSVGRGRRQRAVINIFAAEDETPGAVGLFDYSSVTADTVLADV